MTKMTYVTESGTQLYQSKLGHGKNERNFELLAAEEFIAAITHHIPPRAIRWSATMAGIQKRKRDQIFVKKNKMSKSKIPIWTPIF